MKTNEYKTAVIEIEAAMARVRKSGNAITIHIVRMLDKKR
jgi:hypothetical protein